jgi:hypothetical protein
MLGDHVVARWRRWLPGFWTRFTAVLEWINYANEETGDCTLDALITSALVGSAATRLDRSRPR